MNFAEVSQAGGPEVLRIAETDPPVPEAGQVLIKAKAGIAEALQEHIWPHIENGKIKPVIAETFALQEVAKAHRLMESSRHIGKIVLTV